MDRANADNGYRFGSLPKNAPLAMAYVPLQESVSPSYESMELSLIHI